MTGIKNFLFKYKHAIILLYIPIYMLWFMLLEQRDNIKFNYMHCAVDDIIPFCEIFIVPYLLWFVYVAFSLIFLFFQTKYVMDFYKCAAVLLLGMTTCLIIYTIFPNAQNMRPATFERDNVFTRLIAALYAADTDTNVCPSIHVYNSIAIHVGIAGSHYFRNKNFIKNCSLVLCILICLSTLFLKQHSFVDLVCAVILYIVYYIIIYKPFSVQNMAQVRIKNMQRNVEKEIRMAKWFESTKSRKELTQRKL